MYPKRETRVKQFLKLAVTSGYAKRESPIGQNVGVSWKLARNRVCYDRCGSREGPGSRKAALSTSQKYTRGSLACGHRVTLTNGAVKDWFEDTDTLFVCPTCKTSRRITSVDGPESLGELIQF